MSSSSDSEMVDMNGTSDWQIRCPKCGRMRDAAEAGLIRVKAASIGKVVFGKCSQCNRLQFLRVERKRQSAAAATE